MALELFPHPQPQINNLILSTIKNPIRYFYKATQGRSRWAYKTFGQPSAAAAVPLGRCISRMGHKLPPSHFSVQKRPSLYGHLEHTNSDTNRFLLLLWEAYSEEWASMNEENEVGGATLDSQDCVLLA